MFRIQVVQRIGIDVDDEHGEEPGDGAALVDLAVLQIELDLPFAPFPGLDIRHRGMDVLLEDVIWDHKEGTFLCRAQPLWTQTQSAAQGIVDALIEAGFCPLDSHHREDEVH
jgi:hypothetical protein